MFWTFSVPFLNYEACRTLEQWLNLPNTAVRNGCQLLEQNCIWVSKRTRIIFWKMFENNRAESILRYSSTNTFIFENRVYHEFFCTSRQGLDLCFQAHKNYCFEVSKICRVFRMHKLPGTLSSLYLHFFLFNRNYLSHFSGCHKLIWTGLLCFSFSICHNVIVRILIRNVIH